MLLICFYSYFITSKTPASNPITDITLWKRPNVIVKISLKAKVNGKYVCANDDGNLPLIAISDRVADLELFELYWNCDHYTVNLKSMANS